MMNKLQALRAQRRIWQRQYNVAARGLARVKGQIEYLEKRNELARTGKQTKRNERAGD
jgi:hypothetical protein